MDQNEKDRHHCERYTVIDTIVILNESEEKEVKAEDLVIIDNRNGNKIMTVCRTGVGSNENLRAAYLGNRAYACLAKSTVGRER